MVSPAYLGEVYWDLSQLEKEKSFKSEVKEFEVYFLRQFLKEAEKSMPEGLFNTSFSYKLYYDLFASQVAETLSSRDLGLESFFEKAIKAYSQGAK